MREGYSERKLLSPLLSSVLVGFQKGIWVLNPELDPWVLTYELDPFKPKFVQRYRVQRRQPETLSQKMHLEFFSSNSDHKFHNKLDILLNSLTLNTKK